MPYARTKTRAIDASTLSSSKLEARVRHSDARRLMPPYACQLPHMSEDGHGSPQRSARGASVSRRRSRSCASPREARTRPGRCTPSDAPSKNLREEVAAALVAVRISGQVDCPPPAVAEIEAYNEHERAASSGRIWGPSPVASARMSDAATRASHRVETAQAAFADQPSPSRGAWLAMLASLFEWLQGGVRRLQRALTVRTASRRLQSRCATSGAAPVESPSGCASRSPRARGGAAREASPPLAAAGYALAALLLPVPLEGVAPPARAERRLRPHLHPRSPSLHEPGMHPPGRHAAPPAVSLTGRHRRRR